MIKILALTNEIASLAEAIATEKAKSYKANSKTVYFGQKDDMLGSMSIKAINDSRKKARIDFLSNTMASKKAELVMIARPMVCDMGKKINEIKDSMPFVAPYSDDPFAFFLSSPTKEELEHTKAVEAAIAPLKTNIETLTALIHDFS